MSFRVQTGSFSGPFDLLLSLVSRQKVDIGAISVADRQGGGSVFTVMLP